MGDDCVEDAEQITEESPQKQEWGNKVEFLFSCISYAVGIGNLWRFPYLAQDNGGGTFLIPYLIMLVIEGMPLFYLEMCVGQLMRKGVIGSWSAIHPTLAGIGWAAVTTSFLVGIYYNVIIVWSFFYLFSSFQHTLPWSKCSDVNGTSAQLCRNATSRYFWYNDALEISGSINDAGSVNWKLCLILLLAWTVVFCAMAKGIKAQGKIVYFTTLYPYVILLILFFRGVFLEGAGHGIKYLFQPDWDKLYDPDVWRIAATQIFYSLGLGFGGLVAYSSYNKKDNNTLKDTLIITLINSGTSIFGAIVIFSILGHLSVKNGIKLSEVGSGPGLAFIAFSEGLTLLVPSVMWSIFFFLMLLCLGIGSMFGTLECVLACMADVYPFNKWRREVHVALVCAVSFLVGISMVTQGGSYVVELFDQFAGSLPLLLIGFCECFAVSYIYGASRFSDDVEAINGLRPSRYWRFCWRFLSPILMVILFLSSVIYEIIKPPTYQAYDASTNKTVETKFPGWAEFVGAVLIILSVINIPIFVFLNLPPDWKPRLRLFLNTCCGQSFAPSQLENDNDSVNSLDATNPSTQYRELEDMSAA
ncbi:sodium-dependent neutral amino acid transporter B(0)AT1-like [Sycon ciliatum]|uniref:sodium-dependent neutral amino acid transporter B(0)AT1-like n=1 Tax=Sycon ciliatum TaxID=27933 RepID=UPI0020AE2E43|eukprot:scpid40238/ scgid33744/ Sodium- and chloride-dependent GABA transporter 1; Solute carrier family 6 member 1 &gt; Sodium- and chloride-dependent GABA transporter 1; Solute carrier family 6 member 1